MKNLFILAILVTGLFVQAQTNLFTLPYTITSNKVAIGQTVDLGKGVVQLTQDIGWSQDNQWQGSAMWGKEKINLDKDFYVEADMYFGCMENKGGDGIAFVLQNDPRGSAALGAGGGNLGFGGNVIARILKSIAIEFDTYNGNAFGGTDIDSDHISVLRNGFVSNIGAGLNTSIWGPEPANRDLEACVPNGTDFYSVRIEWKAPDTLKLYEANKLRFAIKIDRANFGSNMVYWGFTAGTGSASNEHWVAPKGSKIPWECSLGGCKELAVKLVGDTICEGESYLINSQVSDNKPPYTYKWSTGEQTPYITVKPATTATYTLTVINFDEEYVTSSVVVHAIAKPETNAGENKQICIGESTQLKGTGGYMYQWSTNQNTAVINVAPTKTTVYTLTTTKAGGCSSSAEVTVTVNPLPVADAGATVVTCDKDYVTLYATGGQKYKWSTGDVSKSITVQASKAVLYTVTVTNDLSCVATDTVSVVGRYCEIEVPKVITPDGDGVDDYFKIKNVELRKWEVKIYSKWGAVIFETAHYENKPGSPNCWDAKDQEERSYMYVIKTADKSIKPIKGFVNVMRK